MAKNYCVNKDATYNPGYHHEVHTVEHTVQLGIRNVYPLGSCKDEVEAVNRAKKIYSDADGCKIYCPKAYKG